MANLTNFRGKRDLTSGFDGGVNSSIPTMPTHCQADGCRNYAVVLHVEATYKAGIKKLYAFSEVCRKTGDNMQPNDGVTFHRWHSWCAHHYMRAVDAGRKSVS